MIKLNRITSQILALSMMLTTITQPLTSYAYNDSATGDGNTHIDTSKNVGDWGNIGGRSGYRISIVDADDPTKVISLDKDGNPQVVDIILCTEDDFNYVCGPIDGSAPSTAFGRKALVFSNAKTQSLQVFNREGSNNIHQIFWPDRMAELLETDKESYDELDGLTLSDGLQWMNNMGNGFYLAMGEGLRYWFNTNKNGDEVGILGSQVKKSLGNNVTLPDGTKVDINNIINKETEGNKATEENKKQNNSSNADKKTTSTKKDTPDNSLYNDVKYNITMLPRSIVRDYSHNRSEGLRKYLQLHRSYLQSIQLYANRNKITYTQYLDLRKLLNDNYIYMANWKKEKPGKLGSIENLFGIMTAYAASGVEDDKLILEDEDTNITEDGTKEDNSKTREEQTKNHLGAILAMKDSDGSYIFKTASTLDKPESNILDATEKWRILVEPVDWFTPYDISGKTPLIPQRFYGTISNIVDAMEILGVNKILNGAEHLNRRTFNKVSWSALSVAENAETDTEMFNGKYFFKYYGQLGQKTNKQLYDMNQPFINAEGIPTKYGWAVQVYWVDDLENLGLNKDTDSSITTWDDETYSDGTPGPAPDASNEKDYPPEDSFKELSKKFNISKFYYFEYLTEDGKTIERLFDTQTRKDTPHTVVIKHEGDIESDYYWKVVKWATGKEKIMPENGDTSRTYEEYCINNPGDYIGNDIGILNLVPEDKDQILYVKLVLVALPKKPTVVKIYETNGNTDKVEIEKNVEIPNNVYEIKTPEEDYKYIESTTDFTEYEEEPKSWNDVPKENGIKTETTLTVDETTQIIYIRYERVDGPAGNVNPVILHEDELAFPYSMDDLK